MERALHYILSRKAIVIAVILGVAAITFSIFIQRENFFPGDLSVTNFWQSLANPTLTLGLKGLSYIFGDWRAALLTTVCVVLILWRIGKREALMVVMAGLLSLLNYLFKALIGRPRPSSDLVQVMIQESNNSFPSSHAFFSILLLGTIIYLLNKHLKKRALKITLSIIIGFLIVLVGITRIYLGVHWYSDVIAGYIFGGFFLTLLIMGYETWQGRRALDSQ
jgi:membrane-associated phospholipid phosphatase